MSQRQWQLATDISEHPCERKASNETAEVVTQTTAPTLFVLKFSQWPTCRKEPRHQRKSWLEKSLRANRSFSRAAPIFAPQLEPCCKQLKGQAFQIHQPTQQSPVLAGAPPPQHLHQLLLAQGCILLRILDEQTNSVFAWQPAICEAFCSRITSIEKIADQSRNLASFSSAVAASAGFFSSSPSSLSSSLAHKPRQPLNALEPNATPNLPTSTAPWRSVPPPQCSPPWG